jgi:hypothetical protein
LLSALPHEAGIGPVEQDGPQAGRVTQDAGEVPAVEFQCARFERLLKRGPCCGLVPACGR